VAGADHNQPLREQDLDPDPLAQFQAWFDAAAAIPEIRMPEAAAVATATVDGVPSARMVLVKQFDPAGFVFYTGYESRKGRELAANPRAALLFYWDPLGRQVRIEGPVSPVSREETVAYSRGRPRGSQLSALASAQSRPIADRATLETRVRELASEHEGAEVPVPESWGGFRLRPELYEFWQNRSDRLHDRLAYLPAPDASLARGEPALWRIERLQP
jgi:pyridoxamine 5'-phosphate oxidase